MSQSDINNGAPQVIDQFIGQPRVVQSIRVALNATACGGPPFPHTLLCGPAGLGKTEAALLIGKEQQIPVREALGQSLKSGELMAGFLMSAKPRDILFVDEIQESGPQGLTQLYRAMSDRQVYVNFLGNLAVRVQLPEFTLLAATTDEYALPKPLRDRFELRLPFSFYKPAELAEIVRRRLLVMRTSFDPDLPARLGALGKGVPRLALRLLKSCMRESMSQADTALTMGHLEQACDHEGIETQLGLDATEQAYLRLIAVGHGPIRPTVLAAQLDLPLRTLQRVTEPFLLRTGLVDRARDGRCLTDRGRDFVESLRRDTPATA